MLGKSDTKGILLRYVPKPYSGAFFIDWERTKVYGEGVNFVVRGDEMIDTIVSVWCTFSTIWVLGLLCVSWYYVDTTYIKSQPDKVITLIRSWAFFGLFSAAVWVTLIWVVSAG